MLVRGTTIYRKGGVLLFLVAASAPAADLNGQDRIDPASSIRVFEGSDRLTGRIDRWVVDDLLPAEVLRIQVELGRAGFDPGVRSGVVDSETRGALRRLQTERGLLICGCVTYETIVTLRIKPDVVAVVAPEPDPGTDRRYGTTVIYAVPHAVIPGLHHKRRGASVIVGHDPAVGAGQTRQNPLPRSSVGVREIQTGSRPASTGKPIRPGSRPQRP